MKYNYPQLTGICKAAIEKGLCLGCNRLEELSFRGIKKCKLMKGETNERDRDTIQLTIFK